MHISTSMFTVVHQGVALFCFSEVKSIIQFPFLTGLLILGRKLYKAIKLTSTFNSQINCVNESQICFCFALLLVFYHHDVEVHCTKQQGRTPEFSVGGTNTF